jgi:carbohydrate diacid regulator
MDYGINLHKPSQIVYAEFPDEIQENTFFHFPCFQTSNHSLWIVIQEEKRIATLLESIKSKFPDALISISKMNDLISEGFMQAKAAMRILKGLFFNEKVISYARYEFIADLSERQRNHTKESPKALLLHENEDLIKTLQVYLSCNLNVNETAKRLIIHRNTLSYRLNRIYKITGKNPQNILELVELIFMLINRI